MTAAARRFADQFIAGKLHAVSLAFLAEEIAGLTAARDGGVPTTR